MNQSDKTGNNLNVDLLGMDLLQDQTEDKTQQFYIPSSIDFYSAIVMNDFMVNRVVEVQEGDIINEGYISKYKLYLVKTKKCDGDYDTEVMRRFYKIVTFIFRFSDFEWLYQELINKYGGYIIPQLPEKHLLTKINMESYEFSEKRRKELENFLQKLFNHRHIRFVPELRVFIQDKEKFISLLKGELVQNKTLEQKYDNIISSVKGFFSNSTPTAIQNFTQRITDLVRTLDNSDKDLNNHETTLTNLSVKAQKLKNICIEQIQSLREQDKLLSEEQDLLVQWDGLGPRIEQEMQEPFQALVRQNMMRSKAIYTFTQELEEKFITPLQKWIVDTDAAIQACERRRALIKVLIIDQQRIEELKLSYSEANSRRDIEMDILKTKYQKNKDKSERMSTIMIEEIGNFTTEAQLSLRDLLKIFQEIHAQHGKNLTRAVSLKTSPQITTSPSLFE